VQLQPADADACEPRDLVAEIVEHHADLPLEAHFQHDVRPVGGVEPRTLRTGESLLGHHSFDQLRNHLGGHRLIDDDFVFFFRPLARMNQPMGEITAVGEQDDAFAFFVEAADVMQVLILLRQQIVDRHPLMRVTTGAEVALRLVQGEDDRRLRAHGRTVHDDLIPFPDLGGQLLDDMPVNGHTPAEDDLLRTTP